MRHVSYRASRVPSRNGESVLYPTISFHYSLQQLAARRIHILFSTDLCTLLRLGVAVFLFCIVTCTSAGFTCRAYATFGNMQGMFSIVCHEP